MTVRRRLRDLERSRWPSDNARSSRVDLSVLTDDELEWLAAIAERVEDAGPVADVTDVLTPDESAALSALDAAYRDRLNGRNG